jgi:phenylpyruvate tautomerase PptA (4-oxalocrotonate tautomerase family)
MPQIVCNTRAGMDTEIKAMIAARITDLVHNTIKSPRNVISVIFNDLAAESSYVGGKPGHDTVILCTIRLGRTDGAKQALSKGVSDVWHECTGQDEEHIEVAVQELQAKYVVRGGKQMPEPPFA